MKALSIALVGALSIGTAGGPAGESAAASASVATASTRGGSRGALQEENIKYDGRFTMARIKFRATETFGFSERNGGPDIKWDHDWPRSERHLMKILDETTSIEPHLEIGNVYTTDDPELMKFPLAYLCEVGFWEPSEKEVIGLRNYLLKGGFLIIDDFRGRDWNNFYTQIHRVLPDIQLIEIDTSLPIFHSFFEIKSLDFPPPYGTRFKPVYFGMFEDNDRTKRMMAAISYNNDISDDWEWSDTGMLPLSVTNEAYKLGVNYIVYAMTH